MILLLVKSDDFTVQLIITWLKYLKKEFIVLNELNYIENIDIDIEGELFLELKNGENFRLSDIKSMYIRRGRFWFENNLPYKYVDSKKINEPNQNELSELQTFINKELKTLEEYIVNKFRNKVPTIGEFNEGNLNKLEALSLAREVGLEIPKTVVVTNKNKLSYGELITKAIHNGFNIKNNQNIFHLKTHEYIPDNIPSKFAPTLFQKKITKKFELRVFFLKGEFYSMAIFSQQQDNTKVDYRNFDSDIPTKTSPYRLPNDMKIKLTDLMNRLNLTTGSIDLIYSQENKYIFLEVNPTGQFGMVSTPCNYNIEKRIAEML